MKTSAELRVEAEIELLSANWRDLKDTVDFGLRMYRKALSHAQATEQYVRDCDGINLNAVASDDIEELDAIAAAAEKS